MTAVTLSNWEMFSLLLWKNFWVYLYHRWHLCHVILSPMVFGTILIVMRLFVEVNDTPAATFESIDLEESWTDFLNEMTYRREQLQEYNDHFEHNVFIPQKILAYAPDSFHAYNEIIKKATDDLGSVEIKGFENCKDLRKQMIRKSYLAGVCFEEHGADKRSETEHLVGIYPNRLQYSLVFPSELRMYYDTHVGYTWNTHHLYDKTTDQRNPFNQDGGYVGYIREGFIPVQNAISMAYIKLVTNKTNIMKIKVQRFPFGRYDYDSICDNVTICLTNVIYLGLTLPVLYFSKLLISDKEENLHGMLHFLGAKHWIKFIAWFLPGYLILSLESIFLIIIVKINWFQQYPILPNTLWSTLFFVLLFYNMSTLCFTFMISSLFTKASCGIPIMGIFWFYSNLPFLSYVTAIEPSILHRIAICIFSNSTMSLVIYDILNFEKFGNGFHWSSLFDGKTTNDGMTIGLYLTILIINSFIYTVIGLIALRMQTNSGSAESINSRHVICNTLDENRLKTNSLLRRMTKVYEIPREDRTCTMQIKELKKDYNTLQILNNINLDLFENEITALIGHNGAGKTTLLLILLGLTTPTGGTVVRNGLDISNIPRNIRPNVGFCLHDDCLFKELTVENQIKFFGFIRGLSQNEAQIELEKYLKISQLNKQRLVITQNLDPASIKTLAVCCALVGGSKFIFLDDPMSGLDLTSRKTVWEIINSEKKSRTILLSTHAVLDAEYFADRIAILSGGELKCSGSTMFIKKLYGGGFRLIFTKNASCNVEEVTAIVQNYIPNILPECDVANELSYTFDEIDVNILGKILEYFEENLQLLGLNNCLIREISLEDIYLKMGSQYPSEGEHVRHSEIMNGYSIYAKDYTEYPFLQKKPKLIGCSLLMQQCTTMLWKRFAFSASNITLTFVQFILPIFLVSIAFIMANAEMHRLPLPSMTYNLRQYSHTITVLDPKRGIGPLSRNISDKYDQMIFWKGIKHGLVQTGGQSLKQFMVEKLTNAKATTNKNYIIGATISNKELIAWFSNYPLHTAPLSLNMLHQSILRSLLDDDAAIKVSLYPLPYVTEHNVPLILFNLGLFLAITISFTMSFFSNLCVISIIKERNSKFKLMQLIAGLPLTTYWLCNLLYDIIRISAISCIILFTILVLTNHVNFHSFDILICYFAIIVIAGACTVSFAYLLSRFYSDPIFAYSTITVISLYGACAFSSVLTVLQGNLTPFNLSYITQFWHIFPTFNMGLALYKIFELGNLRRICADKYTNLITVNLERCNVEPNCCVNISVWNFKYGIVFEVIIMVLFTVINLLILLWVEHRSSRCSKIFMPKIPTDNEKSAYIEHKKIHSDQMNNHTEDLIYEKIKVQTLKPRDRQNKIVVWDHVGRFDATNNNKILRYYFMIERGECIGLVGKNSCGKSHILKMIVGEEAMHFGIAHVNGISFDEPLDKIWKNISYSVQGCSMLNELTVKEVLRLYCALHGIPKKNIDTVCESISKIFEFYDHYYKMLAVCAFGIKKRVCNAVAFLGNRQLIVLDEPSTNLDIAARRILWHVISIVLRRRDTVILTSLEPRDCERICTRVGMLSNGDMLCLHNPNELVNRYVNGYILLIRLKASVYKAYKDQSVKRKSLTDPFISIGKFVEHEFHNSLLKEQIENVQTYYIPKESLNLTSIFKTMRDGADDLNIENFNITRANLLTVYLQLSQNDHL